MDKKIDKNLHFTRILSVLAAIILWFYVAYSENPDVEIWIRGINLSFLSEDTLKDNSLAVINDNGITTVSIKVKGQRSSVGEITDKNITATVDLSGITEPGEYNLPINVALPSTAVSITNRSAYEITIHVDKVSTVSKEIKVNVSGNEGQKITLLANPSAASISGPMSITEGLSAVVNVDLSGGISEEYRINLINHDGTPYTGNEVTLNDKTVKLTAQKDVNITADVNAPQGITVSSVSCEPSFVRVSGLIKDIINLNEISLGTINFNWNVSPEIVPNIPILYPQNVTPESTARTAAVKVEFESVAEEPPASDNE